ncbi:hypothetical protein TKWG_02425 [Advenella kashmirensis WT001]|uniref:Uncharacterized protein n=1 Tax=Advenella kashmirensis (strain DSM 17095 / LMG 22695 / WT001) TaxID=1036672 RepID=I3U7Y1_ADVKW|nr:hypothetical protein [Advenella kashmirensis]AFK61119.1 hypothetical protein TKWG_02425 [Advenella kashmirensis WT001]
MYTEQGHNGHQDIDMAIGRSQYARGRTRATKQGQYSQDEQGQLRTLRPLFDDRGGVFAICQQARPAHDFFFGTVVAAAQLANKSGVIKRAPVILAQADGLGQPEILE